MNTEKINKPNTYEDLKVEITKKQFRPIYFFHGDDQFTIDEVANYIIRHQLADEDESHVLYYGDDSNIGDFFDSLRQVSMFTDKRVILVRKMEKFPNSLRNEMIKYCQKPDSTVSLIMLASERVDTKSGFFANLTKLAYTVVFWARKGYELERWIKKQLEKSGKSTSLDVIQWLAINSEGDLFKLANEIEKLVLYSDTTPVISMQTALEICSFDQTATSFDLYRYLATRNIQEAIKALYVVQQYENESLVILGSIQRYYATVYQVKLELEQQTDEKAIAKKVGVPSMFIQDYIVGAKKLDYSHINTAFKHLLEADFRLKSGYPNNLALVDLMAKLCG
jgi:DNA polymerase III subunit delta